MVGRKPVAARITVSVGIAVGASIAVAMASALAVVAAGVAPVTAGRASPRVTADAELTDAAGHAAHLTPVPYRDAELSVPGMWLVETPQQPWCGFPQTGGMIFVGVRPHSLGQGCHLPANQAAILPAGHVPPGIAHRKPTRLINGIPVYRLRGSKGTVLYLVPELRVRISARGPRTWRVLGTLTRSPLSVVLTRGAAGPVPASWTWRRFGGVRFATPRSWSLARSHRWATCGTGLVPGTLLLIDATRPPLPLPCPFPIPTASAQQAEPGLTVVTGKYAATSVGLGYHRCTIRHGVRICLSAVTGQGGVYSGVLVFSVSRPHQRAGTYFLLGLSGSGTGARTVFDSIRVARG